MSNVIQFPQRQRITTLSSPTGQPVRAWTEQEKAAFIAALKQVAQEEQREP